MTVGFFIDEYLPKLHGDITSTLALRRALEERGHTVYIVTPSDPGYTDTDSKVIRVRSFDPLILRYKTRVALFYPGLAKKLARYKFDVVHSQTQFSMGVLAHETAKVLGVPHVSTMHTVFAEMTRYNKADAYPVLAILTLVYPLYFRSTTKYNWSPPAGVEDWTRLKEQAWWASAVFLNATDAAIAPSTHIAKTLKEHHLKTQCHVLPNGIDVAASQKLAGRPLPDEFPSKGKNLWVVCVGRLCAEKRPEVLIEAMRHVKNPRVKLLLVGTGVDEHALRGLVVKLGLEKRVYILGRREPDDVPSILARSDVFVLPSYRFDNQPMVILEALAAGLPIIYCDDKLTEGLTKDNSLITTTPDAQSIATSVEELASSVGRRKEMSQASLMLSSSFDVSSVAEKVEEIYVSAVARRKE